MKKNTKAAIAATIFLLIVIPSTLSIVHAIDIIEENAYIDGIIEGESHDR
jgi:hypothetical protein